MPCDWPIDETCLPTLPEPDSDNPDALVAATASLEVSKALAIDVMWALSGRQFGICPEITRPCPQHYPHGIGRLWPNEYEVYSWVDGTWLDVSCGCLGSCVRTGPGMVHLPGPVVQVTAVIIDGVELADDAYTVEGDILYRNPASAWWPSQNLSRPAGELGTWSVEYLRGIEPPDGVGKLTAILATEFYNACTGGECRIPRRVESMQRRGVSYKMVDAADMYASGKTGVREVDLWLSAVNPNALMAAPEVL